jgi:hypothetical protein
MPASDTRGTASRFVVWLGRYVPIFGFRLALLSLLVVALVAGGSAAAAPPAAPTPLGPPNGGNVTVPFTISWSQVLDPAAQNGGYNWEVSSVSDFSLLVANDSTFPSVTQATVSGLANGTYFWRVNAVNGALETGAWSATRSFTVTGAGPGQLAAPTLNPPHGGTTQFHPMEAIRFSWSAVAGAATYTTEFSTDSRFPVNSINYYRVTNIPGTTDGTKHHDSMPQGTWFMRVRALDADRVAGAASNVISFSVLYGNPVGPPPTIIAPTGNPTLTLPVTFSWTDGYNPQSSGYEFQVSTSSSFSTLVNPVPGLTNPRIVYTDLPSGQLFWRVRSHQGNASPTTAAVTAWSATATFTVSSAPPVPASVTLTRNPLYSGAEQRLAVQLTARAPAGGAVVSLTSSDPNALPVPATVTIDAGFAIGPESILFAGQVTAPTPVTVTATYNGSSASTTINVLPPTLKSDILQPFLRFTGGAGKASGRLDLEGGGMAPPGGVTISVTSDSPAASPPATVTIPAGSNSVGFAIPTSAVMTDTTVRITASYKNVTVQWQITLMPQEPPASLTLDRASTTGNEGAWGTVARSSAPAGKEIQFALSSSNPAIAWVPPYVEVGDWAAAGAFLVQTTSPSSPTVVTISVSGAGVTRSVTLTVNPVGTPPPPPAVSLSSFSVSPTSVTGGSTATGTVTLTSAAPTGGTLVNLSSNQPGAASVPASVTVAAGATSANFTVTTFPVATTTVQLASTLGSTTLFASLGVNAPPTPAAPTLQSPANDATPAQPVAFNWNDVANATSYEIQVDDSSTIAAPFRANQIVSVSQATIGSLPAQRLWWRVRARNSAGTFGPFSATRRFTPQAAAGAPSLSTLSLSPTSVVGGNTATATVTLTSAAPSGGAPVTLSSANAAVASVPASVTIAAGATSTTFPVTTAAVTTSTAVTLSAAWNGVTRTATVTVTPAPPPASLNSLSLTPASVTGGSSSQGTVSLTSAAPTGGLVVSLSSSNAAAGVPASVTVAAGATSAGFTATTSAVSVSTAVTITATSGGVSRSATLTVNPVSAGPLPAPSQLSPANDARFSPGQTIVFDWSDISGAASYTIQIDDSDTFSSPLVLTQNVSASTFSTSALPVIRMWWRVRANTSAGDPGAWSGVRRFEVKS